MLGVYSYGATDIIIRLVTVKWRDTYFSVHGKYFRQD
jgi:hypothetical protein